MTTDLEFIERIKDNPPGKRGIRWVEIWDSEVNAVLPPGWTNTDRQSRPGERTVVLAQVCKGVKSSWWEKTPDGFEERHKIGDDPGQQFPVDFRVVVEVVALGRGWA